MEQALYQARNLIILLLGSDLQLESLPKKLSDFFSSNSQQSHTSHTLGYHLNTRRSDDKPYYYMRLKVPWWISIFTFSLNNVWPVFTLQQKSLYSTFQIHYLSIGEIIIYHPKHVRWQKGFLWDFLVSVGWLWLWRFVHMQYGKWGNVYMLLDSGVLFSFPTILFFFSNCF